MTPTAGNTWLVPLADLSLILFIVTGATMARMPEDAGQPLAVPRASVRQDEAAGGFVQSVPVAVLADEPGNPAMAGWLGRYARDPGLLLTIHGLYAPQDRPSVEQRAGAMAAQAISAGVEPRVVVEPGERSEVMAVFAYDRDPQQVARKMAADLAPGLARGLQEQARD